MEKSVSGNFKTSVTLTGYARDRVLTASEYILSYTHSVIIVYLNVFITKESPYWVYRTRSTRPFPLSQTRIIILRRTDLSL